MYSLRSAKKTNTKANRKSESLAQESKPPAKRGRLGIHKFDNHHFGLSQKTKKIKEKKNPENHSTHNNRVRR